MKTNERKCVCELKNICLSPVCDQEFEPCSSELNWCRNIGKDGNQCAHDEACHQLTNKAHTALSAKPELRNRDSMRDFEQEMLQAICLRACTPRGRWLQFQSTANPAEMVAQWVPVSEELPKDGKTVIFWIAPAEYASVGKLDVDSRCFHSVGGWVNQDDVSHWMPLPEPPTC